MSDQFVDEAIGPRQVGGRYRSGYSGTEYEVVAIHHGDEVRRLLGWESPWAITERDLPDHRIRTHCTAWDPKRDRVIA